MVHLARWAQNSTGLAGQRRLAQRLHYGEVTGPAEKCSLYLPKAPYGHHSSALIEQASYPERQAAPLPAALRAKPKFHPYGYVPSNQANPRPIGRPYWLVAPPQRQNSLRRSKLHNAQSTHLRSSKRLAPRLLTAKPACPKKKRCLFGHGRNSLSQEKNDSGHGRNSSILWLINTSSFCLTLFLLLGRFSPSFLHFTVVTSVSPFRLHAIFYSLECPFLSWHSCWALAKHCE